MRRSSKDGRCREQRQDVLDICGNKYEENPEYGPGDILNLLEGNPQSFKWIVADDK